MYKEKNVFHELAWSNPCLSLQSCFITMDKIVTFFGFIQNVVAPSRRNGNTDRTSGSNGRVFNDSFPKASASFRRDSIDSGFNSVTGALKDTPSGERNIDRTRASAFTEPKLDTLRGEVHEIKSQPLRYKMVKGEPPKRLVNENVDADNSRPSVLPPVNVTQSSSWNKSTRRTFQEDLGKAATGSMIPEGISSELKSNANKIAGNLPSLESNPRMLHGKQHQTKTEERKCFQENKDLTTKTDLPDIFSNAGKSFVETNQLSVFNRTSFRKKIASVERETPEAKAAIEDVSSAVNGRKSRLMLPKVKRKAKKKKKDGVCEEQSTGGQAEEQKNVFCRNAPDEGMMLCNDAISSQDQEQGGKVEEKKECKEAKGNPRKKKPRTALGRWVKKHSNKVAPAPFGELGSSVHKSLPPKEQGSMHADKERRKSESPTKEKDCTVGIMSDTKVESSLLKDEPGYHTCRTILVKERDENVPVLVVNGKFHNKTELCTSIDAEPEKVTSNSKCFSKERGKMEPLIKTTQKVETSRDGDLAREDLPDNKVAPNYPVKRDLLKETLENVSLVTLNDDPIKKPNVTTRKQLNPKRRDKTDDHIVTQPVNGNAGCSKESTVDCVEEIGMTIGPLRQPSSKNGHYSQSFKTVSVKQKSNKTSEKLFSNEESIILSGNRGHFDAKSQLVNSKQMMRELSLQDDYKVQNLATFDLKQESVGGTGISELPFLKDAKVQNLATVNNRKGEVGSRSTRNPDSKKGKLSFINDSKIQKQVALGNAPSSATDYPLSPLPGPSEAHRTITTSFPQSSAFANNAKCSSADSSADNLMLNGAKPCLPSITPHRKQLVEDFLDKLEKKKQQKEMEDDFEGWGKEDQPEVVKRILERPVTVKVPSYPKHWEPLPNQRPPGRGGHGYCLGVIWKKAGKSNMSGSSSEGMLNSYRMDYYRTNTVVTTIITAIVKLDNLTRNKLCRCMPQR